MMKSKPVGRVVAVSLLVLVLATAQAAPATAQNDPQGWTLYDMNLRAGPGTTYAALTLLPSDTGLVFEARSEDLTWLLGHTLDGTWRGWLASLYLRYAEGFVAAHLPVSSEVIDAPPAGPVANDEPAPVPSGVNAWTSYVLNLRAGPGTDYVTLTVLSPGTGLVFEGRNEDSSWLLGHSADGTQRGWVSALYVRYADGFTLLSLPVSEEIVDAASVPDNPPLPAAEGASSALLMSVPVIPTITPNARAIYLRGGNNPRAFSKIGDCNSEEWIFMSPFDTGQYDLGPYGDLQATVDFFRGSFARTSPAANIGFNALTVNDATWADPAVCQPGESPVWCELRLHRPAVAVIMFGANDVHNLAGEQFEQALRQVVERSIRHGTIPVLSTFSWCGGHAEKAVQLNMITVSVAREYDVPMINFWRAARDLPNCGMGADGIHLSTIGPPYGAYFTGEETQAGFTLRNLVTLQTLDALRQQVLY